MYVYMCVCVYIHIYTYVYVYNIFIVYIYNTYIQYNIYILSMHLSWQEYWSEWSCPLPGDLPKPGIKPMSPALQVIPYH